MKKILVLSLIIHSIIVSACSKDDNKPTDITPGNGVEKNRISGRVTGSNGQPIGNVQVVVEHTVLYATYVYAITNNEGYYAAVVPNGSWKATVQIEKNYLGKNYRFDLHPDNALPFSGNDGATRNFSWKLSGAKPEGGFYGSNVAVYPEPGSELFMENVELTLQPDGLLADGSHGQPITKKLLDIGGGEDGVNDIPIGKYTITAKDQSNNQPLQVRLRNSGEYADAVTAVFTSGFTGSTSYQIVVQVK